MFLLAAYLSGSTDGFIYFCAAFLDWGCITSVFEMIFEKED